MLQILDLKPQICKKKILTVRKHFLEVGQKNSQNKIPLNSMYECRKRLHYYDDGSINFALAKRKCRSYLSCHIK